MEEIERAAFVSVGRACGFAGFAVLLLMVGLSFEPVLAARTGCVLCLMVAGILYVYAARARSRPYKRTEVWTILPRDKRPPAAAAQRIIGQALHETYLWFARQAAIVSGLLLAASVVLRFIGGRAA